MSVRVNNQKMINGGYVFNRKRFGLHPQMRGVFADFIDAAWNAGYRMQITSGHRSEEHQRELYLSWYNNGKKNGNGGRYASPPGHGIHELGLAIDVQIWVEELGKYDEKSQKARRLLKEVAQKFAYPRGLRWGGKFSQKNEEGHFDFVGSLGINGVQARSKKKQYIPGQEKFKYIILDGSELPKTKGVKSNWSTEIGAEGSTYEEFEYEPEKRKPPKPVQRVEETPAVGIWQIIKVIADRYALSQSINDATIAFDQGSLINFVKKVVQEPWLEFFGDTYRDQYYFTARKERFDQNGFRFTADMGWTIEEQEVIADDLNWYNGPIYSWYQIIPQGSFLGEQNQIFAHVTAVFFEEYAEVWGSKPLSVVNNYLNFVKNADGPILYEKALQDLRYMVESNCYLPFTREGTITLRGAGALKRGYWIFYKPTKEFFYIDGVNHRYQITDGGEEVVTTLKVSRGMEYRHLVTPKDKTTKSYWNLILFDDPPPITKIEKEKVDKKWTQFFFDNDRSYLINLDETWPPAPDTRDKKMENQIKEFPNLRKELHERNVKATERAVQFIEDNPDAPKYECLGWIDEDFGNKNNVLPINRAKTIKNTIIEAYMKKHPAENRAELEKKIVVTGAGTAKYGEEFKTKKDDPTPEQYKLKAYERLAEFRVPEYFKDKEVEEEVKGVNWKVNDEVFQYFLNRKQFNKCN